METFVTMTGKPDGCILSYCRLGHGMVNIPETINPWQVLGLHSSNAPSRAQIKAAFKGKITQSLRQNRAMASVAYHMPRHQLVGTCKNVARMSFTSQSPTTSC